MGRKDKKVPLEDLNMHRVGARMRLARQQKNIILTVMAEKVGYSKGFLSLVETDKVKPTRQLVEQYEDLLGLNEGDLTDFLGDEQTQTSKSSLSSDGKGADAAVLLAPRPHVDLREAPVVKQFYGREQELAELRRNVLVDQCTLISILGFGGVGKTTLAAYFAEQIENGQIPNNFTHVFYRSLQNKPLLEDVLEQAISFLSEGRQSNLPEGEESRVRLLLDQLRKHRCLLVFDNFETVMGSSDSSEKYEERYQGYARLLQRLGESKHQSCLVLTSRERPGGLTLLDGAETQIRSMVLQGMMEPEVVRFLLKGEGLEGSDEDWNELIRRYSGNPLALRLISAHIRDIFAHDIASFLNEGDTPFGDISSFIGQQFARLTEDEQHVLYWLSLRREPVSLDELRKNSIYLSNRLNLAVNSLRQRFLIEVLGPARFELQPIIADYVVERCIITICREIEHGDLKLFASLPLLYAQARDHIRQDQKDRVLYPIKDYLLHTYGQLKAEQKLIDLLAIVRKTYGQRAQYAAGNILNLLLWLKDGHLERADFSQLVVRQAYLQGMSLHEVNFKDADLSSSVFTQTFKGVVALALSPNGKTLATGTVTGEIWLWDAQTGDLKNKLRAGDVSWICWSVAFSPDGRLLANASEDTSIRIWEVEHGKLLHQFKDHTAAVKSVMFSPDGRLLASGSDDNTVRLWDRERAEPCIRVLEKHTDTVNNVKFNKSGTLLASASTDKTIGLWRVEDGEYISTFRDGEGEKRSVFAIDFSPDEELLASGGDSDLCLWRVKDGQCIQTLEGHKDRIRSVKFSPDGRFLASGSEDSTVRLWKVQDTHCEFFRELHDHSDRVWSIVFSKNSELLVSGSTDQTVLFWRVEQENVVKVRTLQGYANAIRAVTFSPQQNLLASVGEDTAVSLWKTQGEPQLYKTLTGHNSWVWSSAFNASGELLASGGDDKIIRIWNIKDGVEMAALSGHSSWIRSLAFHPNGELLASGSAGHTIRLWNVNTKDSKKLSGHEGYVRSLAFSRDGQLLASGSDDKTIRLWRADAAGNYVHTRVLESRGQVWSVQFSPNGLAFAGAGNDSAIQIWPVHGKKAQRLLETEADWIASIAFHPEANLLASGGSDKLVLLWDLSSGRVVEQLRGHTDVVYSVAFSPDGKLLASASREGTIKLWNAQTLENIATLKGEGPYNKMNIAHVQGPNQAQKEMLKTLGAIED